MVTLTCGSWQSWQLLANTTAFHCQHYARFIKSLYFTVYSTATSWFDDELPSLPSKLLSGNVGTHLPQYVACTAGAPVCSFVSNRAEPINCERNSVFALVVVYYGWMGRVEETTFLSIPWQKKPRECLLCGRGLPHYSAWWVKDIWQLKFNCHCDIYYWGVTIYQQQKKHVMRYLLRTTTTLHIWRKKQ